MSEFTEEKLWKQGAEAKLYRGSFLGKPVVIKERFSKKYRHPDLDTRLTKERMRAECRGIMRCKMIGNYFDLTTVLKLRIFKNVIFA